MRATILAGIFGLFAVGFAFIYLFFREEYLRIFRVFSSIQSVLTFYGLVAGYEVFVRFIIGYRIRAKKKVFVETSTPTILIIVISSTVSPFYTLSGPASFAHFLFIILSTLRLDFMLCVITGFVAAVEYAILALFYLLYFHDPALGPPLNTPLYYIGRSFFLFAGGIAARIEQLNKQYQSQLLISEEVWKAIGGVADAVHLGLVQVKGEEQPVSLYMLAQ